MNWAKKLLQPKDDESFTLPSHDCPRCGGRLVDEGDTSHCDTCNYPEPEDDETTACEYCGDEIDPGDEVYGPDNEGPYCSEECMHEDLGDEDGPLCAYCGLRCDKRQITTDDGSTVCSEECLEAYLKDREDE